MNVVDVQDAPFVPTPGVESDSAANFRLLADSRIGTSARSLWMRRVSGRRGTSSQCDHQYRFS